MTEKQLARLKEKEEKAAAKLAAEIERTKSLMAYEEEYRHFGTVAGIDEVGRGPLAGPVVACVCILPTDHLVLELNDSKKLSEKKRERLCEVLQKEATFAFGSATPERIDEINILQATFEAMREAICKLPEEPMVLLNDAVTIPGVDICQVPIVGGDGKSVSIAAASILAKVTRDRLMVKYDALYPGYGFAKNKGYGTAEHIAALGRLGPCPIHRRSFIGHFL